MSDEKRFPKGSDDLPDEPGADEQPWDKEEEGWPGKETPLEKDLETRDPGVDQDAEVRARVQEELEQIRHSIDPNYTAKQRAKILSSMQLDEQWSPGNRLKIQYPKNGHAGNFVEHNGKMVGFRWCHDDVRKKFGPEDWEPITDLETAKKLCPSSHLRQDADGKIYTGDSWLAHKPKDLIEKRNASIFQRSLTMKRAIQQGEVAAGAGESMADLHRKTATKADPVGVRYSSTLKDDDPTT